MKAHQDAYGHAVYDYHENGKAYEVTERADGYFGISGGPEGVFQRVQTVASAPKGGHQACKRPSVGYRLRRRTPFLVPPE